MSRAEATARRERYEGSAAWAVESLRWLAHLPADDLVARLAFSKAVALDFRIVAVEAANDAADCDAVRAASWAALDRLIDERNDLVVGVAANARAIWSDAVVIAAMVAAGANPLVHYGARSGHVDGLDGSRALMDWDDDLGPRRFSLDSLTLGGVL